MLVKKFCINNFILIFSLLFSINNFVNCSIEIKLLSEAHVGNSVRILCQTETSLPNTKWWNYKEKNITEIKNKYIFNNGEQGDYTFSILNITNLQFDDEGNYTCKTTLDNNIIENTILLNVTLPGKVLKTKNNKQKIGANAILECIIEGHPLKNITWIKEDDIDYFNDEKKEKFNIQTKQLNKTTFETKFEVFKITRRDNGTYICKTQVLNKTVEGHAHLYVQDVPHVYLDVVKVVGAERIFLNWTLNDGNEPIIEYFIQTMIEGSNGFTFISEKPPVTNTSYIIKNLKPNTSYKIKLYSKNIIGSSSPVETQQFFTTFDKDSDFVPVVSLKGYTPNSLNIAWTLPPKELEEHVHYYQLLIYNNNTKAETIQSANAASNKTNNINNEYVFVNLNSGTTYKFKVAACSEYTHQCGNWSKEIEGTTMDGVSEAPENVTVLCKFDSISRSSFIVASWDPPANTNGKIIHYNVVLDGVAIFRNETNKWERLTYGPKIKSVDTNSQRIARFDLLPANTNYSIKISGVTRTRGGGKEAEGKCSMPPTVPDKESLNRVNWTIISDQGRYLMKLNIPRVTERNGPICCYRIFLIKLEANQTIEDLPPPEENKILTYEEVHTSEKGGTYIAEMFESNSLSNDVYLGDNQTTNEIKRTSMCNICLGLKIQKEMEATTTTTTTTTTMRIPITPSPIEIITPISNINGQQFHTEYFRSKRDNTIQSTQQPNNKEVNKLPPVFDGLLDTNSNYSGYFEVIVMGDNQSVIPAYSSYFTALKPGPQDKSLTLYEIVSFILQVLCVLTFLLLLVLILIYMLQKYTKKVAQNQGVEMTLRNSLRHICRTLRRSHIPVVSNPPDIPPITKDEIVMEYEERHYDSDYGFQQEFEALVNEHFPDRSTKASEARENQAKNRYPDIKAYDQTRVKLTPIPNVPGSDYINANFVLGYKELKKFICSQGPMENTINDFWRMIWEQHLEICIMLTNLEEYSKVKCAKYWPDLEQGEKTYGDFVVSLISEKKFGEYILREIKIVKTVSGKDNEERNIFQYHYLAWKDFQAPENPSGLLKFIKHVNEAYSLEKGPILVHCSAGVGRTGTLVALDSLLQQLKAEGQVSVFNTVCDLRRQRNFLVQSIKQYIFIYRALVEVVQFGDTEIRSVDLKSTIETLKRINENQTKCEMELEFDKLNEAKDENKSLSNGKLEENINKNRSETIIPYDRNRVILSPAPKDYSNYINASFIEAYDNTESFIIAQDPDMEHTVHDFWRMISEHTISTIVMLSDYGDGPKKCPRYWPDDEINYEHIQVKYIQSESCPYFTRRELSVCNTKANTTIQVTQYQYNGWPTVEGEVPEVTRGFIELIDHTQPPTAPILNPILVHCNLGSDRSSMFVALSILIQQLHLEKRVDVFSVVRKLRTQRLGMIQTYQQYEFLYRAVLNYSELHKINSNSG